MNDKHDEGAFPNGTPVHSGVSNPFRLSGSPRLMTRFMQGGIVLAFDHKDDHGCH
jgi:hypothetical protein